MIFKNLMNQRGQGVMAVVAGISVILMTSFSLYTIYWQQHLSSNTQVREAYNLMNTMEEAAKDIQNQWDQAVAVSGYGANLATIQSNFRAFSTPSTYCTAKCPASGGTLVLCYPNPNSATPYCFYGGGTTTAKLDIHLVTPNEKAPTFFEKTVEKVALFASHWSGIHLIEEPALASSGSNYRSDRLAAVPQCPSPGGGASSSCMSCGNGNGAICVSIYACPSSFFGCKNFTGEETALFAQQFYLIPPNAADK